MTNRRDTRAKEKESEKISWEKWEEERERRTRENDDIFEKGKYRERIREEQRGRKNGNGRIRRNTLPVSRAMAWHPKQIRETCSAREENNTNRKRRHASFVPRTCLQSSHGMESAEKQTNARVQIFNTTTLGLLHKSRLLLKEHTCGSHARPISQTPALANPWRIASPAQNNKSIDDRGNSKQLSNKIVNLLAFLLLPRDDILHR